MITFQERVSYRALAIKITIILTQAEKVHWNRLIVEVLQWYNSKMLKEEAM